MPDLDALRARLRELDRVVVAFSGGADSAFLAFVANEVLVERALAVTAVSPSLAPEEEADCKELAEEWGLHWRPVFTDELANPAYAMNDGERCFHCKTELLDAIGPLAVDAGATVVLGVNVDDLGDHRPGQRAAAERGAVFPLVDAGFTKADVRAASKALGLRTWDKPAAACLSSRVAYGVEVSPFRLARVERAEAAVRAALAHAGIDVRDLRVRDLGDRARLEVDAAAVPAVRAAPEVLDAVRGAGFDDADLDPAGFRSGSMNELLAEPERYR